MLDLYPHEQEVDLPHNDIFQVVSVDKTQQSVSLRKSG